MIKKTRLEILYDIYNKLVQDCIEKEIDNKFYTRQLLMPQIKPGVTEFFQQQITNNTNVINGTPDILKIVDELIEAEEKLDN